jgi:hypothetical protein
MSEKGLFGAAMGLSLLSLVFMLSSTVVVNSNRSIQDEIGKRQSTINLSTGLVQLNQSLAQALAEIALTKQDTAVHDLLASQGITIRKAEPKDAKAVEPQQDTKKK